MNAKELRAAVVRLAVEKALADETARQPRKLTSNERIAFKAGFYAGMMFDLFQDGNWDAAAAALKKRRPRVSPSSA